MEKHYRKEHGWTVAKPITWVEGSFQTFFQGSYVKYFPVMTRDNEQPAHASPMDHLVDSLLEEAGEHDEAHRRALNKVADSQNSVTLTPWLRRTGWPRMFKGRDMEELVNLARLPEKAEVQLKAVCESVARVIKDCTVGVMDCEE